MKIILKETLSKNGKTQHSLHMDTGIPFCTISKLCNNKTSSINFSTLEKICKSVPCTPNDILKIEDDPE